jgi:SRSO17 transposase
MGQFVESLTVGMSRPQRARFAEYALALLLPGDRKSMEPMAARIDPEHPMARYKTFQRFISVSQWDDHAVRRQAFWWAEPELLGGKAPLAWLVDDTGFLKKGTHSVFVHRQYTGTAGKVTNCQIGVSLSVASEQQSLPIDFTLYMPEAWAEDWGRRANCDVPRDLVFLTKPELALDQIERAKRDGIPLAPLVADCGYGNNGEFRASLDAQQLEYALEIQATTTVKRPVKGPGSRVAKPTIAVAKLAQLVGAARFTQVRWRPGTKGPMKSRFYVTDVQLPHDAGAKFREGRQLRLLVEWPKASSQPTKFWLCSLSRRLRLRPLVVLAKARWMIERDYEDLKGELGLDHFEGRSHIGWNHHASLCLAAYAFLITERAGAFPPGGHGQPSVEQLEALAPAAATWDPRRAGRAAAA